jgi:hypothetical protein
LTEHDLDTRLRIADPDGFYAKLIELHEGLTTPQSHRLNARLVLLMANQIGDRDVLDRLVSLARADLEPAPKE